jgi:hypothetical protein
MLFWLFTFVLILNYHQQKYKFSNFDFLALIDVFPVISYIYMARQGRRYKQPLGEFKETRKLRGSTRVHCVEDSLGKRQRTCRDTGY